MPDNGHSFVVRSGRGSPPEPRFTDSFIVFRDIHIYAGWLPGILRVGVPTPLPVPAV